MSLSPPTKSSHKPATKCYRHAGILCDNLSRRMQATRVSFLTTGRSGLTVLVGRVAQDRGVGTHAAARQPLPMDGLSWYTVARLSNRTRKATRLSGGGSLRLSSHSAFRKAFFIVPALTRVLTLAGPQFACLAAHPLRSRPL